MSVTEAPAASQALTAGRERLGADNVPAPGSDARAAERPEPAGPAEGATVPLVGLATTSAYPDDAATAFELAADLGYDGVEVMVWSDPLSRDAGALLELVEEHGVPVLSVHAPTLLLTQGVWGRDPWGKLRRTAEHARRLGAGLVVVHPPFRWQRDYGERFVERITDLGRSEGVIFAVENMFPWRMPGRDVQAYIPGWDAVEHPYDHVTLDLSHAATARQDSLELARRLGRRLSHIHLADGSGSLRDEHLPPGEGNQPCAEVLAELAAEGWSGHVVAEVNTRRAGNRRNQVLAETLRYARRHLRADEADGREGPAAVG